MKDQIEALLRNEFSPTLLQVIDDSSKHAGHNVEAQQGGTHFTVIIVSDVFEGKPLLARHRMVYDALKGPLQQRVHALAISAKTPNELKLSS